MVNIKAGASGRGRCTA